jgi:hypothetical protein
MLRVEEARAFAVPREAVFDYITDPANWPAYWPDLVRLEDPSPLGWTRQGDTTRLTVRRGGRRIQLRMTLDELRRPDLVAYHSHRRGVPNALHRREFEPAPDGFVYRLSVSYKPRNGVAGLFDRTLVKWDTRRTLRRTLDNLARRLPDPAR